MATLLSFAFKQGLAFPRGALLHWAFQNDLRLPQSGALAHFAFAQSKRASGSLLHWAFETVRPVAKRHFGASQVIGVGAYDIRVRIDGRDVDACRLLADMTISHAENQSYLCDFWLREDVGEVDVYNWHGKPIEVDVLHDGGVMRLYSGIVDISNFHFSHRRREVKCSDRRLLMINRLPEGRIKAIGYTSQSAHGAFKDKAAELERRMETVPASFEFDAYGTGYLTPWKPKAIPDRVIGNCQVYRREPRVSVLPVGRAVNRVNIKIASQFMRLWQRDVGFEFNVNSGTVAYNPCSYQWFGLPPEVSAVKSAIEQAGWAYANWRMMGLEAASVIRCSYSAHGANHRIWSPVSRKATHDENGKLLAMEVFDYTNYYAKQAWWDASRRWTQNADEVYSMTLSNAPSIGRYGEIVEELSFAVQHDGKDEDWGRDYRYAQAVPSGFKQAANGDFYRDLDNLDDELRQTLQVAYWTAYTKILSSHRENILDIEIKFLPEIDLRHTHRIEHQNFTGNVKVAHFTHDIDFIGRNSQTSVQYKFYQNAADALNLTPFAMPDKPPLPVLPAVNRQVKLGTVVLPMGAEAKVDGLNGFIVQTTSPPSMKTHERRKRIAFALTNAAIEKTLTDAMETTRDTATEVAVFNDDVRLRMV